MKTKVRALAAAIVMALLVFSVSACQEATLDKIEIISTDHKTVYMLNDALNVTNLKIKTTLTDGTTGEVDVGAGMVSGFDSSKIVAAQTLTVTYALDGIEKTAQFDISVKYAAPTGYKAYENEYCGVCYPTAWTATSVPGMDLMAMNLTTGSVLMVMSMDDVISPAEYTLMSVAQAQELFLAGITESTGGTVTKADFTKLKMNDRNAMLFDIELDVPVSGMTVAMKIKAYVVLFGDKTVVIAGGGAALFSMTEVDTIFNNIYIK